MRSHWLNGSQAHVLTATSQSCRYVGCHNPDIHPLPFVMAFIPRRVEGRVDLGTAVRGYSLCPKLCIAVVFVKKKELCTALFDPGLRAVVRQ